MTFVVAIDGPAGTGKSSAALALAKKYNFIYVDTGAIYRALAYLVEKTNTDSHDIENILKLIDNITVSVNEKTNRCEIIINGSILDRELRTENISQLSSIVSQHQKIREALLQVQRNLTAKMSGGAIFEGRDIGTVVFPHAPLKIFITANSETRAKRRFLEIKHISHDASFDDILSDIKKRDERDAQRAVAPMLKADDAHLIDTSDLTLEEVIKKASFLIDNAQKNFRK